MKKIIIAVVAGIMLLSALSHAATYKEGDSLPCGKIYHKQILRNDTATNFAMHKPSKTGVDATGASSSGNGVSRSY